MGSLEQHSRPAVVWEPAAVAMLADAVAGLLLEVRPKTGSTFRRPKQCAYYGQADLASLAAYLAHGIAETQPFLDGNKRTAAATIDLFLGINGYSLEIDNDDLADLIWNLNQGMTPEELADEIRPLIAPTQEPT
jgi:death-on-curing family protein